MNRKLVTVGEAIDYKAKEFPHKEINLTSVEMKYKMIVPL
jgi:hypothetical protein